MPQMQNNSCGCLLPSARDVTATKYCSTLLCSSATFSLLLPGEVLKLHLEHFKKCLKWRMKTCAQVCVWLLRHKSERSNLPLISMPFHLKIVIFAGVEKERALHFPATTWFFWKHLSQPHCLWFSEVRRYKITPFLDPSLGMRATPKCCWCENTYHSTK